MTRRIRVGIIGANPDRGWAAEAHIPALQSLPEDFEITALSTSRRESADAAGKRFAVPRAFDNHQDLVNSAEVDVVEPMGHEAYVTAVCAGETVTSRFPPRSGVRTRERIELAFNPARLHLFDARSGNTILQRPVAGGAELARSVGEARVDESEEGRSERPRQPDLRSVPSRPEEH